MYKKKIWRLNSSLNDAAVEARHSNHCAVMKSVMTWQCCHEISHNMESYNIKITYPKDPLLCYILPLYTFLSCLTIWITLRPPYSRLVCDQFAICSTNIVEAIHVIDERTEFKYRVNDILSPTVQSRGAPAPATHWLT